MFYFSTFFLFQYRFAGEGNGPLPDHHCSPAAKKSGVCVSRGEESEGGSLPQENFSKYTLQNTARKSGNISLHTEKLFSSDTRQSMKVL